LEEYSGKLEWVKREKISSSMCIMFAMKKGEIDQFWKELQSLKVKWGESFFLYLSEERPKI
jgi:hypothetical protein